MAHQLNFSLMDQGGYLLPWSSFFYVLYNLGREKEKEEKNCPTYRLHGAIPDGQRPYSNAGIRYLADLFA